MLENLEAYLDTSTTPELRDLIMDACEVLLKVGVDNHLFLIRNAIDEADAAGDFDVVYGRIIGTLLPLYHHHLREFGIKAVEEAELHVLVSLFKAVTTIEDWGDPETLNALCDGDEDVETTLADIAEIVGDLTASDYLMVLESVSDDLIKRIGEITTPKSLEETEKDEVVEQARVRLRELLSREQVGEDAYFVEQLANGMRLGQDFESLIQPHLPFLSELAVPALARELVCFALASSLAREDIVPALNALKENFSLSIIDLMSLDTEIRRLLGDQ